LNVAHIGLQLKSPTGSQLAARMSPNKPIVDLPVFLFELKDLPGMLDNVKSFGKSLPHVIRLLELAGKHLILAAQSPKYSRRVAHTLGSGLLQYQFGWAPLISDLLDMTSIASHVERRLKQLTNLHGEKGLRRRVNVDKQTRTILDGRVTFNSSPFTLSGQLSRTTTAYRWAVTRWSATQPSPSPPTEFDAIRTLLGLNIDAATIWAGLPWSWMIDWFTEIGTYLDAHRNTVPCKLTGVWLMTTTSTTYSRTSVTKLPGLDDLGGTGLLRIITKERERPTLSILPSAFPFLGGGQVGILASLSVAKQSAWRLT